MEFCQCLRPHDKADRIKLRAILDYDNVQMNKLTTEQQQVSAMKMETMTHEMREIAVKTEKETVSMRIVTWVTLFFLPGTFVSVSFWTTRSLPKLSFDADRNEHSDCSVAAGE